MGNARALQYKVLHVAVYLFNYCRASLPSLAIKALKKKYRMYSLRYLCGDAHDRDMLIALRRDTERVAPCKHKYYRAKILIIRQSAESEQTASFR